VYSNGENIDKIRGMRYFGSDISAMMNRGGMELHNGLDLQFSEAPTIKDLFQEIDHCALFYGLSVSLRYALRNASDFKAITDKTELSIFNRLSLSRGSTRQMIYGTGKHVYIISLPELINVLDHNQVYGMYCTANMQYERDGEGSLRASIILSKDWEKIREYIQNYTRYIDMSLGIENVVKGEWKDIHYLKDE